MQNILGISIGTRNVGLAVTIQRKLVDHRIRTYAGKWDDRKCEAIADTIDRTVMRDRITCIVVKAPTPSHMSPKIEQLLAAIQAIADMHSVSLFQCTIHDIKRQYGAGGRCSKHQVISALVAKYPELQARCGNKKREYIYHSKLFEAIACAERAQGAGQ